MGGKDDVAGKISASERSCPAVSGIPIHYLPLVLGRQIERRQTENRQLAHISHLSGRNGGRGLVIEGVFVTYAPGVLEIIDKKRYMVDKQ